MTGLEGHIRPEGRPGHRHRIEKYAGTAAALHQRHTHNTCCGGRRQWTAGVHANEERMAPTGSFH